jgi:hypothetical protein
MDVMEESRRKLRKEIVVLFSKFEYLFALKKAKNLMKITKRLFFQSPDHYYYTYLVDSLLLVKCFIRQDKLQLAEETIAQSWKILEKFYNRNNFKIGQNEGGKMTDLEVRRLDKYISRLSEATSSERRTDEVNWRLTEGSRFEQ